MSQQLPQELFGLAKEKINHHCIYLCVKSELSAQRQGTHKTKTLAEVSGSNIKPWRQKGTGRARAGTRRSPIFTGGGIVFGPTPDRNYIQKVPKKQRMLALLSVLALLKEANKVKIEDLSQVLDKDEISTKKVFKYIEANKFNQNSGKLLIATKNPNIFWSCRNLPKVRVVKPLSLTISLLQSAGFLLLDLEGVEELKQLVAPFVAKQKPQNDLNKKSKKKEVGQETEVEK